MRARPTLSFRSVSQSSNSLVRSKVFTSRSVSVQIQIYNFVGNAWLSDAQPVLCSKNAVKPFSANPQSTPCAPLSSAVTPGGVGEDCLSPCRAAARASCAPRRKSPWVGAARRDEQRRGARRAGEPGRFFFGYFLLSAQKKVTSCRATPGEVDVEAMALFCRPSPCPASLQVFPCLPVRLRGEGKCSLKNKTPPKRG
jgi:hypothetical protein